uniref:Uncharacterized protein n=1 Tax=Oryza glumipatula TaxID=40148 RepID=A0A0D9Z755_9ORYZ
MAEEAYRKTKRAARPQPRYRPHLPAPMSVTVDGKRVLHIRCLRWKFRVCLHVTQHIFSILQANEYVIQSSKALIQLLDVGICADESGPRHYIAFGEGCERHTYDRNGDDMANPNPTLPWLPVPHPPLPTSLKQQQQATTWEERRLQRRLRSSSNNNNCIDKGEAAADVPKQQQQQAMTRERRPQRRLRWLKGEMGGRRERGKIGRRVVDKMMR